MLNGLDLFSGIGGLAVALAPWVRPIAYCENDRHANAILLSRMRDGQIINAPIWDDVRTLSAEQLRAPVDIIYGGFPCQDISAAGLGRGLGGERSGLVGELFRLVQEIQPAFVFLENVPAIRTRGLGRLVTTLARLGYDCRWTIVSAQEVGAHHIRKRWFLLAHAPSLGRVQRGTESAGESGGPEIVLGVSTLAHSPSKSKRKQANKTDTESASGKARPKPFDRRPNVADSDSAREPQQTRGECKSGHGTFVSGETMGDTLRPGLSGGNESRGLGEAIEALEGSQPSRANATSSRSWPVEPNVGRVANGVPLRVDRLRGLGNSVVPKQAREAFERLMGLK